MEVVIFEDYMRHIDMTLRAIWARMHAPSIYFLFFRYYAHAIYISKQKYVGVFFR
jgi:hypothetical protein